MLHQQHDRESTLRPHALCQGLQRLWLLVLHAEQPYCASHIYQRDSHWQIMKSLCVRLCRLSGTGRCACTASPAKARTTSTSHWTGSRSMPNREPAVLVSRTGSLSWAVWPGAQEMIKTGPGDVHASCSYLSSDCPLMESSSAIDLSQKSDWQALLTSAGGSDNSCRFFMDVPCPAA